MATPAEFMAKSDARAAEDEKQAARARQIAAIMSQSAKPEVLPGEEATFGQEAAHVGAGAVKGMIDLANLPGTVASFATGRQAPERQSEDVLKPGYQNPVSKWVGDKAAEGLRYLSKPRVKAEENPVAEALRTGMTYLSPGRFKSMFSAANLGGMAGPTAVDAALSGTEWKEENPGLAAGGEILSSILGSIGGNRLAQGITDPRALEAIRMSEPELAATMQDISDVRPPTGSPPLADALRGEVEQGVRGTTADLTGSPGLYNMEQFPGKGTPGERAIQAEQVERLGQQRNLVEQQFGDADPNTARLTASRAAAEERAAVALENAQQKDVLAARSAEDLEANRVGLNQAKAREAGMLNTAEAANATELERIAREQGLSTARLDEATTASSRADIAADTAIREGTPLPKDTASAASKQVYDAVKAKDDINYKEQEADWKEVDAEGVPVDVDDLKKGVEGVINGTTPSAAADFERVFANELKQIREWEVPQDLRELAYMKSKLAKIAAEAAESGSGATYMTVQSGQVSKVIDDFLASHPVYAKAVASTDRMYKSTRSRLIGPAMKQEAYETLVQRLNAASEGGDYMMRVIKRADAPGAEKGVENWIRAKAHEPVGGVSQSFINTYAPALEHFPDLKAQLQNTVDKKTAREGLGKALKAVGRTESSVAKKLSSESDASKAAFARAQGKHETAVGQALRDMEAANTKVGVKSKQAQADVDTRSKAQRAAIDAKLTTQYADKPDATIKRLLKSDDQTEDLARFYAGQTAANKASIRAHAKSQLLADATEPENFKNLTPKTRQRLVDAKVVTREEMDLIEGTIKQSQADKAARANAKSVDYPGVQEKDRLVATLKAQFVAEGLSKSKMTSLPLINALSRFFLGAKARAKFSPKIQRRVEEFLANPEEFVKAFDTVKDHDAFVTLFTNKLHAAAKGAALAEEEK